MDDIVIRSMQKWPNVPNVFGWLRLDRRGQWLVKSRQSRAGAGVFERIGNAAVVEFIGRNYACDDAGRWFFQNGPQRVFVALDYTPLVYRLRADGAGLEAHTGAAAGAVRAAWIDEGGAMILAAAAGPGVVLDRDLPALADRIVTASGAAAHDALEDLASGAELPPLALQLERASVPLASIAAAEVPTRFGFDPDPRPAPGEPEC